MRKEHRVSKLVFCNQLEAMLLQLEFFNVLQNFTLKLAFNEWLMSLEQNNAHGIGLHLAMFDNYLGFE